LDSQCITICVAITSCCQHVTLLLFLIIRLDCEWQRFDILSDLAVELGLGLSGLDYITTYASNQRSDIVKIRYIVRRCICSTARSAMVVWCVAATADELVCSLYTCFETIYCNCSSPSLRLVTLVPTIYWKSESRRNFKFIGDTTQDTSNSDWTTIRWKFVKNLL